MQLWEAGHVRLDDPLTAYLPWARLKSGDEDSVPISLRALLSHSAGLPRESDFPYWTGPDFPFPTEAQFRAKLAQQTPLWSASRWYQYSNLGLASSVARCRQCRASRTRSMPRLIFSIRLV